MNPVRLFCLLILLALGGSCKKPLDVVEVGEPPLPPEGCRIVKETYWLPNVMGNGRTETIQAEGKQYTVKEFTITRYLYNEKGQIIREQFENNKQYYTTYEYKADSIIKTQISLLNGEGPFPLKTIYRLNAAGLDASKQYDAEGCPIGPLGKGVEEVWEGGNLVRHSSGIGLSWTLTHEYKFNLNRPNLPNIYPFLGKTNKNLMIRESTFSPDVDIYKPGELFRFNYYYQYDRLGRVKRLIRVGKDEQNSGWPYGLELDVFDYEYECP